MSECAVAFAFGLTQTEFIIICLIIGGFVGGFCALVNYLNGSNKIGLIDIDLCTDDELRRLRLKRR